MPAQAGHPRLSRHLRRRLSTPARILSNARKGQKFFAELFFKKATAFLDDAQSIVAPSNHG
jgi:hypothetical protein